MHLKQNVRVPSSKTAVFNAFLCVKI